MKKLLLVMSFLLLGMTFVPSKFAVYQIAEAYSPTIKELIIEYAREYNTDSHELIVVADCESDFLQYARGRLDEIGVYQYRPSTFKWFAQIVGEELDIYSAEDQIRLTAQMFSKGEKYKKHWTCYRMMKRGII